METDRKGHAFRGRTRFRKPKAGTTRFVAVMLAATLLGGAVAEGTTTRVLLVGDSWAQAMWNYQNLRDVFSAAGFPDDVEKGDVTAIGGTTAAWWAQSANLALITSELNNNPTIDLVHLSMGGNDFLAGQSGGGWYVSMGSAAEDTLFDTIEANIQTVIEHILNIRPTAHIVICSYDYINLWDTLNIPANAALWANLGSPTPRQLNEALIRLGERQRDLAQAFGAAVTYGNNWGQMHYWEGYNSVFGPGTYAAPWGHPSYPWEKSSVGGSGGDDAIHLNDHGYDIIAVNLWNGFYQYFIDPNGGPLPTGIDDYYPDMPPADYETLFYDGFESGSGSWIISGASLAFYNTYWGIVSLELDNSDYAIRAQNTSGYENIKISYANKTSGYDWWPQDKSHIEYTTNYGSSWNIIQTFTSNFDWTLREHLLPSSCNSNPLFGIRYRSQTNSGSDNAWLDEVRIMGTAIPYTLYTLTVLVDGAGSVGVSPPAYYGNNQYIAGTNVTLTATPVEGWTFNGWSGSISGTTNPVVVNMNAAKTITATFVDSAGKPGLTPGQGDWMKWVSWNYQSATWPVANASQNSAMYYRANEAKTIFETYQMPYGQAANIWYTDYTRSTVSEYHAIGDSATLLGYYLGGLCNEYAVTSAGATLTKINDVLDTLDWMTQCTGKNGYIPRFVGLTNDPAYIPYYTNYGNGYDTCVAPWQDYTWLDYSSRDVYIGVGFGLANVWIHVSDTNTRAKCQAIAERILDQLIADSWNIVSPNGPFTNLTPGFVTLWQRLAITMNDAKYGSQTDYGTWFWLWHDTGGMDIDDKWYSDYFANVLDTSMLYAVRKLETNQDKINALNDHLLKAAETDGGDHLNVHMAACYLGATGDSTRNVPRGVLQGGLIDLPSGDDWMIAVDNSNNPAYPHKNEEESLYAILPHDRIHGEYLWQQPPCELAGGADAPIAYMMLGKYVPYWMGRQCGAISAP
jgi:lysophospholipase L1-like esterase